ncbi:MAG TPA: O-antigen ligase family protein [Mangrovimonas sp.]|nr:O-antigen ligase family protein [Mangrovimonas sp.]
MKLSRNIDINGIILILLLLYLGVAFFSVAISNILLAMTGVLFLLGIVLKKVELEPINWKIYFSIIAPYILTVISTLNSSNIDPGLRYLFLRLPIIIIPFLLVALVIGEKQIKNALKCYVVLSIIASGITLYHAIKYFNEDILFKTDFTHFITIIQHPYFGIYLLVAVTSILEYRLFENKYLRLFFLIILSIAIALTTSRIVYLLYFGILGIYFFKKLSRVKFIVGILSISIIGTAFLLTNKSISNKFANSFNYSKSPRLKLWENSLEAVRASDSYMLGIGIGDYYKEKKDPYFAKEYGSMTVGQYGYNPHSQPIEFFLTNGFLGVLLLLIALYFLIDNLKGQNIFAKNLFFVILVFSLTECILNRQYGVQLYSVLLPLILKKNLKKNSVKAV